MMKVTQAAERLETTTGMIYSLIAAHKLGCHRLGQGRGSIRITEVQLQTYLDSIEQKPESPAPRPRVPIDFTLPPPAPSPIRPKPVLRCLHQN